MQGTDVSAKNDYYQSMDVLVHYQIPVTAFPIHSYDAGI